MKNNPWSCTGFTLAEVIIILIILSVTLALALPRLAGVLERNALNEASNFLAQTILLARDKAMLRQERWGMIIDLDRQTVHVQSLDKSSQAPVALPSSFPHDVYVKSITVAGSMVISGHATIRFLPIGLTEPCRITLADSQQRLRQLKLPTSGARLTAVQEAGASTQATPGYDGSQPDPAWEALP